MGRPERVPSHLLFYWEEQSSFFVPVLGVDLFSPHGPLFIFLSHGWTPSQAVLLLL